MLSIKRIDRLLEKMSRGEPWSFPAKIPRDDDTISVYSVDVTSRGVDSNDMTSLIPSSGILFNLSETAPSPCKDYCQIVVTLNEVTFRLWKISLRNHIKVAPIELKNSHEDFPLDERARSEILRVFGKKTYDYVLNLVHGQIDYLPRLPRDVLLKVVQHLDLEDVAKLSVVSKQFREICNSDELWEQIYLQNTESANVTEQLYALAHEIGWKRLFFTNKLQLQVQLRRQAKRMQEHGDAASKTQDEPTQNAQTTEPEKNGIPPPKKTDKSPDKQVEPSQSHPQQSTSKSPQTSNQHINVESKSTPFLTEKSD